MNQLLSCDPFSLRAPVGRMLAAALMLACLCCQATAAIITNAPLPITHQVTVQPIIVSNDNGTNTAEYMGNAAQTAAIQGNVDLIWAQAGIDVLWLAPNTWDNTFANIGSLPPNVTRPTTDLTQIAFDGVTAGVANPNPRTLNMYFVEISPGFPDQSELTANGLAQLNARNSTMHIGDDLPTFFFGGEFLGQQLAAKTIAHEIGHNLGLDHNAIPENLMLAMDTVPPINARLNATQISSVINNSPFVVAVPEPGTFSMGLAVMGGYAWRRRRAA